MIANYGYQDGSGVYYVTIDTTRCADCAGHWCAAACPQSLFIIETDDYDDEVATVANSARNRLKECCAPCKTRGAHAPLPCTAACRLGAITHSW